MILNSRITQNIVTYLLENWNIIFFIEILDLEFWYGMERTTRRTRERLSQISSRSKKPMNIKILDLEFSCGKKITAGGVFDGLKYHY